MSATPTVSIVMIFLDEARFIGEAIESVLAQTFEDWELLLVDDGSSDESSTIAQHYARRSPEQIRYVEHPGHENRGMSASRNLGLAEARGEYVAFLDADDVWLPSKLSSQVPQLDASPDIGMIYCTTRYWHSWTGHLDDSGRDTLYQPVQSEALFDPPDLLKEFLADRVLMPCHGSILVRREALEAVGGWENSFRGVYEDQIMFVKLCLNTRIRITPDCHDFYRQHDASSCAVAYRTDGETIARYHFHEWLGDAVQGHPLCNDVMWSMVETRRARSRLAFAKLDVRVDRKS